MTYVLYILSAVVGVTGGAFVWYRLILPRISNDQTPVYSSAQVYEEWHKKRSGGQGQGQPGTGGMQLTGTDGPGR